MLMQQKTSCDAMIDEKNKLINDFQQVMKYLFSNFFLVTYDNFNNCMWHSLLNFHTHFFSFFFFFPFL